MKKRWPNKKLFWLVPVGNPRIKVILANPPTLRVEMAKPLPEPGIDAQELIPQVLDAMKDRGFNQAAVCSRLSISPVYFSLWLRNKQMPKSKHEEYTYALDQWLKDTTFSIVDGTLVGSGPPQA